ncbi:class I SAM-dependent methyltransferase [Chitinophaga deserti]|uniref:class I SAM-dependent methyltransferase n=1 Tax=Chitinophaga deserti TaxID=2164099 RepID=UPI000D6AA98E|nr:class I SAM-dependent methyltransferase [Chitinophaga deserti]
MQQNKYDDPEFFLQYSRMPRSTQGLNAAGEWSVLRKMLPPLEGKTVLDLGCGFGWHCRYAREQGAAQVTGIDISEKMLEQARQATSDEAITYRRLAIEDIDYPAGSFDVVLSSLALHYVAPYADVCRKVFSCLQPGGSFVLSTEHPIFTALPQQDWYTDAAGKRLHWPVDRYQDQGLRHTTFLGHTVAKYHRTLEALLNGLLEAGFQLQSVAEPQPTAEILAAYPEMQDETRRPIFLLVAALKPF